MGFREEVEKVRDALGLLDYSSWRFAAAQAAYREGGTAYRVRKAARALDGLLSAARWSTVERPRSTAAGRHLFRNLADYLIELRFALMEARNDVTAIVPSEPLTFGVGLHRERRTTLRRGSSRPAAAQAAAEAARGAARAVADARDEFSDRVIDPLERIHRTNAVLASAEDLVDAEMTRARKALGAQRDPSTASRHGRLFDRADAARAGSRKKAIDPGEIHQGVGALARAWELSYLIVEQS